MVDRFGESILLRPEGGGLGLVVWGLPVAALALGAGGLALALRRWRRQPQLHPTEADEALVERARS
jgi:cytochrome c-type biogenesis protein CcmH